MSYRILIPGGIEYPTDPATIRKLKRGEKMSYEDRCNKRAECGDVVDDLPKESGTVLTKKRWRHEGDKQCPGHPWIEVVEGE